MADSRDAVAGIVDDLCHALGVDRKDVIRIDIAPGTVDVLIYDRDQGTKTWDSFTWRMN